MLVGLGTLVCTLEVLGSYTCGRRDVLKLQSLFAIVRDSAATIGQKRFSLLATLQC